MIIEVTTIFLIPCPIIFFGALRWMMPNKTIKKWLATAVEQSALLWVTINHWMFGRLLHLDIEVIGAEAVNPKKNYFIIANHQSWLDILMLEEALSRRTGFSRYFIKKNLTLIPLAGWACHMLNYPYMYRFSKEHLAKHPEDRGKDVAITKRACKRLQGIRFKLNNFPEGTRFTMAKHDRQSSPYRYLLKPKTAGIAYALGILHEQFDAFLNMTIVFSHKPHIAKLFFGDLGKITVIIEKIPITPDLIGDYQNDQQYRTHFQTFITDLWTRKEALMSSNKDYQN